MMNNDTTSATEKLLTRMERAEEGFRAFQAVLAVLAICFVVVASILRAVATAKARTTTKAARAAAKVKAVSQ